MLGRPPGDATPEAAVLIFALACPVCGAALRRRSLKYFCPAAELESRTASPLQPLRCTGPIEYTPADLVAAYTRRLAA